MGPQCRGLPVTLRVGPLEDGVDFPRPRGHLAAGAHAEHHLRQSSGWMKTISTSRLFCTCPVASSRGKAPGPGAGCTDTASPACAPRNAPISRGAWGATGSGSWRITTPPGGCCRSRVTWQPAQIASRAGFRRIPARPHRAGPRSTRRGRRAAATCRSRSCAPAGSRTWRPWCAPAGRRISARSTGRVTSRSRSR